MIRSQRKFSCISSSRIASRSFLTTPQVPPPPPPRTTPSSSRPRGVNRATSSPIPQHRGRRRHRYHCFRLCWRQCRRFPYPSSSSSSSTWAQSWRRARSWLSACRSPSRTRRRNTRRRNTPRRAPSRADGRVADAGGGFVVVAVVGIVCASNDDVSTTPSLPQRVTESLLTTPSSPSGKLERDGKEKRKD